MVKTLERKEEGREGGSDRGKERPEGKHSVYGTEWSKREKESKMKREKIKN